MYVRIHVLTVCIMYMYSSVRTGVFYFCCILFLRDLAQPFQPQNKEVTQNSPAHRCAVLREASGRSVEVPVEVWSLPDRYMYMYVHVHVLYSRTGTVHVLAVY